MFNKSMQPIMEIAKNSEPSTSIYLLCEQLLLNSRVSKNATKTNALIKKCYKGFLTISQWWSERFNEHPV